MGVPADFTMTARKIGQSRHIVLGTASHFEVRGEPSTPAELQQHRAVVYAQKGGGARWTFRHGATEDTVTLRDGVRVTAAEGVREAGFAGLGLCVATEWMLQPDLDNGAVRQAMRDWELPGFDVWAGFPTGRRKRERPRLRRVRRE
jgi:DNA-binding transcriptional LysR family regulator